MFKKREEIKEILSLDVDRDMKKDMLADLDTTQTDVTRIISITNEEASEWLAKENGEIVSEIGRHWSNHNSKHLGQFIPEQSYDLELVFFAKDVKGYEVQYFSEDIMENDVLANLINTDTVYQDLCSFLGTAENTYSEAEVLVNNNTKFKIENIYDEREEGGHISVYLELV